MSVDRKAELYVALGASTVWGAVHHFKGEKISRTDRPLPARIADALGMELADLSVGTTGFLARGTHGTANNFMDQIYQNDALFRRARLITLTFGYGNDAAAGLPIGEYDDYYPYDEDGYHPAGQEGIAVMLARGATLMGCLNWCIKWCAERYPRAVLIPILGAPSINKDRAVALLPHPEGAGSPKYKLSFRDPFPGTDLGELSREFDELLSALGLTGVNMIREGTPLTWYATYAKGEDGAYALFSTKGERDDPATWKWNSHPNDAGYSLYAAYVTGKVLSLFRPTN